MEKLNLVYREKDESDYDFRFLNEDAAKSVMNYHKSFSQYNETPLVELKNLAKEIGVKDFFVKDESYRFGLNAFKVLGGSYAIGKYLKDQYEIENEKFTVKDIEAATLKNKNKLVLVTATDGNHGRGVAWTANKLKQKCKVFMPKGTVSERLENIRKEGADAEIYECNYDECVRLAKKYAENNNGVLIQDTSWKGYEEIPKLIMQGYMTFAYESILKLQKMNKMPTHIFLQAGVGSLAAAVIGIFANVMKENKPKFIIVEPSAVDCYYKTADINDGKIHNIGGDLNSIMAGLCCGEPATIAWEIIRRNAEYFISAPDYYSAHGMRILGNSVGDDKKIISGESGAITSGVFHKIMTDESLLPIREKLELDNNSIVYCVSTEGDTDKKNYREIVWDGSYQSLNS